MFNWWQHKNYYQQRKQLWRNGRSDSDAKYDQKIESKNNSEQKR